jgi:hypothetical protein
MKTKYKYYEKKQLSFEYFGDTLELATELTDDHQHLVKLNTNVHYLTKIGLTNPFTFKASSSYKDWAYKNNKEDQWKKISNPEQLAFFFVLNTELHALYGELE